MGPTLHLSTWNSETKQRKTTIVNFTSEYESMLIELWNTSKCKLPHNPVEQGKRLKVHFQNNGPFCQIIY